MGVHHRGEEDGRLRISRNYVDGVDGTRLLADRHWPACRSLPARQPHDEVAAIITPLASAPDYAHKQGLLHRNV